ncbi:MAG: prepilin peptidase [Planctomycetales bacterium]|nr:prepilin peptidase [Planctomycetales bacterium]
MPRGMSVVWKPSHCPQCSHPIRAYDNVPVLGWLWLQGRCRDCGQPISPRYAIVEFLMGLTFFLLAYLELFSGGANLPGGPITEFTGAVQNVWYPQWALIAWYGCHCLLLSFLASLVLLSIDSQPKSPWRWLLAILWLTAFLAIPFWKQATSWLAL